MGVPFGSLREMRVGPAETNNVIILCVGAVWVVVVLGGLGSSCFMMLAVVALLSWFFVVSCLFLSLSCVLDVLCVRFLWCSLLLFVLGFSFWYLRFVFDIVLCH